MIIISQDKKQIFNFNNIQYIDYQYCVDKVVRIFVTCVDTTQELGVYKTEERAKEVFLGIIELYKKDTYYKETSLGQGIYSRKEINHTLPKVYEMPEE